MEIDAETELGFTLSRLTEAALTQKTVRWTRENERSNHGSNTNFNDPPQKQGPPNHKMSHIF